MRLPRFPWFSVRIAPIIFIITVCLLAALLLFPPRPVTAGQGDLLVFAAASTTNVVTEIGQAFKAATGLGVVNSFAASSTLAKQIDQGAPADVYISANVKWMDWLARRAAIDPGTRFNLARNRLALIVPASSPLGLMELTSDTDLAALLADSRLAMGDPDHVPAGIYARQALVSLGLWDSVKTSITASATVRAALALVERGEAELGVVFATDAAITDRVRVVALFPQGAHRPIIYPAAGVAGRNHPARAGYLEFLKSDAAAAIFRAHGFLPY